MSEAPWSFLLMRLLLTLSESQVYAYSEIVVHVVDGEELRRYLGNHIVATEEESGTHRMEVQHPAKGGSKC